MTVDLQLAAAVSEVTVGECRRVLTVRLYIDGDVTLRASLSGKVRVCRLTV